MTNENDVTEADRVAAKAIWNRERPYASLPEPPPYMVQAFARHRTQAVEAERARVVALEHMLGRMCDAYELVCSDTGKNYHQSAGSVYAHCRAMLARGDHLDGGRG